MYNEKDEWKNWRFMILRLKKYSRIWDKFNNWKKWLGCEQVYGGKYLKIKPKLYVGKINTIFHDNEMFNEDCCSICLSVILIDFA